MEHYLAISIGPCYQYIPPWHAFLGIVAFICAICLITIPRRHDSGNVALTIALIFATGIMFFVGHKNNCSYRQSANAQNSLYSDSGNVLKVKRP